MPESANTIWTPDHFIGGHPAIDFTNAVYDRRAPARDNELLKSTADLGNWLAATGLASTVEAARVADIALDDFIAGVWQLREASHSVFDALASHAAPPPQPLGLLFEQAAKGLAAGQLEPEDAAPTLRLTQFHNPEAVLAFLAASALQAYYTLPLDRLHACPRCGWLFVDRSRGGKRRWCSMKTCGNREKASRHKDHAGHD